MIYHLTTKLSWKKALEKGVYKLPLGDKMIHCSIEEEVIPSANLHFSTDQELLILGIPEKRVKHLLKWELSRNDKLFPHIYGPISLEMVETLDILKRNQKGQWEWIK